MKKNNLKWMGALAGTLCCAGTLLAQNVGQWDFNSGDLTQTSGANLGDMTYTDGSNGQTFFQHGIFHHDHVGHFRH